MGNLSARQKDWRRIQSQYLAEVAVVLLLVAFFSRLVVAAKPVVVVVLAAQGLVEAAASPGSPKL